MGSKERGTGSADLIAPQSRLPQGGENLFQAIKRVRSEAEARGIRILNLSIGQPSGPALESARRAAAEAVMSEEESMHEYQDNDSLGVRNFARRFVQAHVETRLDDVSVDFLPIPGIKPMLGLIPLACGANIEGRKITVGTTTNPGYPTPRDWSRYLGQDVVELPLNPENGFLFPVKSIPRDVSLIMMNYPHNPSGQVANFEWLKELCDYCAANNIRIFNDAAYIALSHSSRSTPLTDVANLFPRLSWAEAFSASKLINNGTGWRVGAIVGSPDFVGDIKTIKGNTDSGFVAPMAAGVLAAIEKDQEGITRCRQTYERRLYYLTNLLTRHGMKLAVKPSAGFFTLWRVPREAFGEPMRNAEHFNFTMIEKTGVTGVHFNPDYIRYAVCGDIKAMLPQLDEVFKKAAVSY